MLARRARCDTVRNVLRTGSWRLMRRKAPSSVLRHDVLRAHFLACQQLLDWYESGRTGVVRRAVHDQLAGVWRRFPYRSFDGRTQRRPTVDADADHAVLHGNQLGRRTSAVKGRSSRARSTREARSSGCRSCKRSTLPACGSAAILSINAVPSSDSDINSQHPRQRGSVQVQDGLRQAQRGFARLWPFESLDLLKAFFDLAPHDLA